jgi:uncharacterized damage-inducible protein DinB
MQYEFTAISDAQVPRAREPIFQNILDTYASETNKVVSIWNGFADSDLSFKPHEKSSTVLDIMKHQLLSERRFFAEFLGLPEVEAGSVLPSELSVSRLRERMLRLAAPRLGYLSARDAAWWLTVVPFFDAQRQRIWIFWRRVLHTSHHRTQLTVYLRLLNKTVPATYGPTADVTWKGADPTLTVEAAGRTRQPRLMTDDDRREVGRASHELASRCGKDAYRVAAQRAEAASLEGDVERAQFWKWVEASVKPRHSAAD